jgi:rare lipoprotein A
MTNSTRILIVFLALAAPAMASAQTLLCEDTCNLPDPQTDCYRLEPEQQKLPPPLQSRVVVPPATSRYSEMATRHRLTGNASYYSSFFDGRKTANGEIYRNSRFSAAHLTLPLGCWVEVRSRATGKVLRLRVNDRGPYSGGFVLDLSRAAARALGVDVAEDRRVDIRVIAMPGEEPDMADARITGVATEELEPPADR